VPTVPATKFFDVTPSLKSVFDRTGKRFCLFGSSDTASRDVDKTLNDDDADHEYRKRSMHYEECEAVINKAPPL